VIKWGLVVEGFGETAAFPALLGRVLRASSITDIELLPPVRKHRSELLSHDGLEKVVKWLRIYKGADGAIIILLDANSDLPCLVAPERKDWCEGPAAGVPVSYVMAKSEFETWFLGAIESLRGTRGIRGDAESPLEPESIRDAKLALTHLMEKSRVYSPTADQEYLAARFDYEMARTRCPSLDKLLRDIEGIIATSSVQTTSPHVLD